MKLEMRIVEMARVQPGMRLARPLFAGDGRILLQEGVHLSSGYIQKLANLGFAYVYIDDAKTSEVEIFDAVDGQVRQEVVAKIKRVFDKMSDPKQVSKVIHSGELGREFVNLFGILFDSIRDNHTFVLNLSAIYSSDAFLYTHCMNVGILASFLGMAHGYREERIKQLGPGAMLHDIGKLLIESSILDKPGKLTQEEREAVEHHCELGYDILRKQPDLPAPSAHCALQHHEKYDGTGYPQQLKGQDIHDFGRLLAVPDVYDALTSNRVYRPAVLPHEALEFLFAHTGSHFDPQFVHLFAKCVNIYPNGLPVQLSTGAQGVIARANDGNLQRPVVLVLEEQGREVEPYEMDLVKHINVTITRCELTGSLPIVSNETYIGTLSD